MRRRSSFRVLPAALAAAILLTLAGAGGAAAAPRRTPAPAPPAPPKAPAPKSQAWLGVELQDVDAKMAEALDLPEGEGALVSRVVDDSPAAEAGLADGDVIVSFDGQDVRDANALTKAVHDAKPGARASVVVIRDGAKKTFKVELGSRKAPLVFVAPDLEKLHQEKADQLFMLQRGAGDGGDAPMVWTMGDEPGAFLGIMMTPLTEQLGRYFGAPDRGGVLVSEVVDDSPAAEAGLEAGDVILSVDDRDVSRPADLQRVLRKAEPGDKLELTVLRDHAERTFSVTVAEPPSDPHAGLMKQGIWQDGPGHLYLRGLPGLKDDGAAGGDDEAGSGERKIIIRRHRDTDGAQEGDSEALREEMQQLRKEVERLREQIDRQR